LVGLQPDIILAWGTLATVALQRETRTIPIVLAGIGDPVAKVTGRGYEIKRGKRIYHYKMRKA
jgi:ABC-type uncharacterized transport system substrate-binding protein